MQFLLNIWLFWVMSSCLQLQETQMTLRSLAWRKRSSTVTQWLTSCLPLHSTTSRCEWDLMARSSLSTTKESLSRRRGRFRFCTTLTWGRSASMLLRMQSFLRLRMRRMKRMGVRERSPKILEVMMMMQRVSWTLTLTWMKMCQRYAWSLDLPTQLIPSFVCIGKENQEIQEKGCRWEWWWRRRGSGQELRRCLSQWAGARRDGIFKTLKKLFILLKKNFLLSGKRGKGEREYWEPTQGWD